MLFNVFLNYLLLIAVITKNKNNLIQRIYWACLPFLVGVPAEKAVGFFVAIFFSVKKPQKSIFTSTPNADSINKE
ncbi:MAG: hypothetical protein A3F91_00845 [Flavobacteria bacterium RIFCSPLOWO2_12_FULL_35_11]|nr:MAG: hypothetical protein A3F91_00845 [Flavobacteria bacterium RIFCSPLOWO2_12_FULL_35_11]